MIKYLILLSFFFGLGCSSTPQATNLLDNKCTPGIRQLGKSPFAVNMFCEDALGDYMAIVYQGKMGQPKKSGWSIDERYWTGEWSKDVRNISFDASKNILMVQTGSEYGTGKRYSLDLFKKEIK